MSLQFSIILQRNTQKFLVILESMFVRRYFRIGTNRYTKFYFYLEKSRERVNTLCSIECGRTIFFDNDMKALHHTLSHQNFKKPYIAMRRILYRKSK